MNQSLMAYPERRFCSSCFAAFLEAALVASLVGPLVACSKPPEAKPTANLSAYNHTPDYIHQYYVNDQWGGNSWAYGGFERWR